MRKVKCGACGTTFTLTGDAGQFQCPGCKKTFVIKRPAHDQPVAAHRPSATPQNLGDTPAAPSPLARFRKHIIAAGVAMLVLAAVLFAAGPFGGPSREEIEAVNQELNELGHELTRAKARPAEMRTEIAAHDAFLSAFDGEMTELKKQWPQEKDSFPARKAKLERNLRLAGSKLRKAQRDFAKLGPQSPAEIYAEAQKTVVVIRTDLASGSGFIVDPDGVAVTCYHVVEASGQLSVEIQKRTSLEKVELVGSRVIAVDKSNDLALIQLPAVPASVAVDRKYPCVRFREKIERPPSFGEDVFAIGNPALGALLLEYTITKGVVSNQYRRINGKPMIQTSASVNPGNSGGPLFSAAGEAVGVIDLKGVGVEAVAFAVMIKHVKALQDKRTERPYVVSSTLAEWEKEHTPFAALARRLHPVKPDFSIPVAGVTQLMTAPDGRTLYLVMGRIGKIVEFDLIERSIGREVSALGRIADARLGGEACDSIFVANGNGRSITRVDRRAMRVSGAKKLSMRPLRICYVGGKAQWLSALGYAHMRHVFFRWLDAEGERPLHVKVGKEGQLGDCACSSSWLCTYTRTATRKESAMLLVRDVTALKGDLDEYMTTTHELPLTAETKAKSEVLRDRLDARCLVCRIPNAKLDLRGNESPRLHTVGADRLVLGRLCFSLGETIQLRTELEESPFEKLGSDMPANLRRYFRVMDWVYAVSADGKWAATGTHVCNLDSGKLLTLLPVNSPVSAFSSDGLSIFVYDGYRGRLMGVYDWQAKANLSDGLLAAEPSAPMTGVASAGEEKLLGPELEVKGIRARKILVDGSEVVPCMRWSVDGKSVYAMTKGGLLRRISVPGFAVERRFEVGARGYGMAVSAEGLAVTLESAPEVWLFDLNSLELRKKIEVPGARHISSCPKLTVAWALTDKDQVKSIDLKTGEVADTWGRGVLAAQAKQARRHPSSDVFMFRAKNGVVTPDGRYMVFPEEKCARRFRISGKELVCEEIGPAHSHHGSPGGVSPDGKYVVITGHPLNARNKSSSPTRFFVYRTDQLLVPIFSRQKENRTHWCPVLDPITRHIYSGWEKAQIAVTKGVGKPAEYHLTPAGQDHPRQILMHPDGRKMLVLTQQHLYWVEVK